MFHTPLEAMILYRLVFTHNRVQQHLLHHQGLNLFKKQCRIWNGFAHFIMWSIWKQTNNSIFKKEKPNVDKLLEELKVQEVKKKNGGLGRISLSEFEHPKGKQEEDKTHDYESPKEEHSDYKHKDY